MVEVEICVADAGGVAAAVAGGATRIELCTALEVGGLTPSMGAVLMARKAAGTAFVTVLIRPRAGDFVYGSDEGAAMVADLGSLTAWADDRGWTNLGFTTGALRPNGTIDAELMSALVRAANGRTLVFHKGFDDVPHPLEAAEQLLRLGVSGALTSGGGGACIENLEALERLASESPLLITAAGGIRPDNVARVAATGVARVHLRASRPRPSQSLVPSAYDADTPEITDVATVSQLIAALSGP